MISNFKVLFVFFSLLNLGACLNEPKNLSESSTAQTPDTPDVLWADVIAYAQEHLANEGYLIQQNDGFAYVKVDDRYIHELFPRLKAEPGYQKPPYFRKNNLPGAHISVIYKDEAVKLSETGQKFKFTIKDIITVHPDKNTHYIILQVIAPELEALRQNYGLTSKLHGHEFHISLAKKIDHNN